MKIADILGGTKKRKKRGSRVKRIIQRNLFDSKPIKEGGNIFPDSVSFDHKIIPNLSENCRKYIRR